MRTTLTLDDDVAAKLREEVRRTGRSFKEVVNETIRTGLAFREEGAPARRFEVQPKALGLRPGLSYDDVGELLEQAEGPFWR